MSDQTIDPAIWGKNYPRQLWDKGLKMENIEAYYNEVGHNDWKHKETGAGVRKAQHPEFEMWSRGFHAPQEAARILAEGIDYARQGELAIARDTKR